MNNGHDAMLWLTTEAERVQCNLCAHRCKLAEGAWGICHVRRNVAGQLRTFSYDRIVAMNVDPIEKKPLFHFLPGTESLSFATPGCNFRCSFCQNWQISQSPRQGEEGLAGEDRNTQSIPPADIVALARRHGCASISYTYTEPTIFFELAYDTARFAHQQGVRNCFVSNGFMTSEAIETIRPYLDAINVDLKAFSDETYKKVYGGRLQPVLDALKMLVQAGIWVEVTTLIVPDLNDSPEELRQIAMFIANELGQAVPWHVSRFHGDYQMRNTQSTPLKTLGLACRLGTEAGLKYVYCGNVPGQADERTCCPMCGDLLIDRVGFTVKSVNLSDGKCPACGEKIEGVWE